MLNPFPKEGEKSLVTFPSVDTDYSDSETSFPGELYVKWHQAWILRLSLTALILYCQVCNVIELHLKVEV